MKKGILLIGLLGSVSVAKAQGVSLAPEVGVNFSNILYKGDDFSDKKALAGLRAGLFLNVPSENMFQIQPGIFFSQKGSEAYSTWTKKTYKTVLNYIEIPVNAVVNFDLGMAGNLFLSAGPYVAFGVGGKYTSEGTLGNNGDEEKIKWENEDNNSGIANYNPAIYKPFDWGFNFGAGYELPVGLYVRGQYGLGLMNTYTDGMQNLSDDYVRKNGVFQLSVGYKINRR